MNGLSRIFWKNNEWSFVSVEDFQVTNGFGLRRLDFIVGYLKPKYDVFFRHLTSNPTTVKEFKNISAGKVILDLIYR